MQIIIIILLLIGLGGLGYLIWKLRRRDEEHASTIQDLDERVEDLSATVEKLRKLPVKGIEAGDWVEQLATVEAALKGPATQIRQLQDLFKEQDDTYRANFQVLADLSQEHFRNMNTHFEEQAAGNKHLLEKELKSLQEKIRESLEVTQEKADAVIESMTNRIDEKFSLEGEARAVMHMQTHGAVKELMGQIEQWQGDWLEQLQSETRQLTTSLDNITSTQKNLQADLSVNQTQAIEKLAKEWEENKKLSDEIFAKIEDNLQELIAEIAARHTSQMSLLADEFDMEHVRYQDLVSRNPHARNREEEKAVFEQLVNLHKQTTERFTRHYYQHLIFMLPTMRKEAFTYFFARIRKNLPIEVERCTFEQLNDRFQQIEEMIMEYAVSHPDGLAEEVARQWKETFESVQNVWANKVKDAIKATDQPPDEHLAYLRTIPRQWLDATTKKKLIDTIQSLAGSGSELKSGSPPAGDQSFDQPIRTQARKTAAIEGIE